jgi:hypothetical protein
MQRYPHWAIIASVFVLLIGWLFNCRGLKTPEAVTPIKPDYVAARHIVCSDWLKVNRWINTSALGMPARAYEIYQSNLSSEKISTGRLYVYLRDQDNESVSALPLTKSSPDHECRFDYFMSRNTTLRIVSIGLRGSFTPIPEQQFRYVLVPNDLVAKLNIDMTDYETVKATFGLAD